MRRCCPAPFAPGRRLFDGGCMMAVLFLCVCVRACHTPILTVGANVATAEGEGSGVRRV
jgi:hypothetical protein